MPEARLERTRKAYKPRLLTTFRSKAERLHVFDAGEGLRRKGLDPGLEEYKDGVLVRRGEIVK